MGNQQPEYLLKKEQKEKETAAQRRNVKVKKLLRWIIYVTILILVVFGIFKLTVKTSGPVLGEYFKAQSREHIKPGDSHPDYNSNPPTGGWH